MGEAIVVCGGEDEGNDSDDEGGVNAVIGPAAVDIETFELLFSVWSSSRNEESSLLLSTASLPDFAGSKFARIGFFTEREDSAKVPLFGLPPPQLPFPPTPSSAPPPPLVSLPMAVRGGCGLLATSFSVVVGGPSPMASGGPGAFCC